MSILSTKWIRSGASVEDRTTPVFRKTFTIAQPITSATIQICGLGLFELRINGQLPDDSVLNPPQSQYNQTVIYCEWDVTALLKEGANVITVELGNGFFNENRGGWHWETAPWRAPVQFTASLQLIFQDGFSTELVSDESWKVNTQGPLVKNSIYQGEFFDARRILYGIEDSAYDDSSWTNAVFADAPEGALKKQTIVPIRRLAAFSPKSIEQIADRSYVVTAPEILAGWAKIRFDAPKDQEIRITYGESRHTDGSVIRVGQKEGFYPDDVHWPDCYNQQDCFISAGEIYEFEPKFCYKGFEFIQIEGYEGELKPEDITFYRVANDLPVISEFRCSNDMINKLHHMMRITILNNYQSKPTDSPMWEKNGWTGDASFGLTSMMYNFNMQGILEHFIEMMGDCFKWLNNVPVFVPMASSQLGSDNSPVWSTVFVFAAEALMDHSGSLDYVRTLYPELTRYTRYEIAIFREQAGHWFTRDLADWVTPVGASDQIGIADAPEGPELCVAAYIYKMVTSMVHIADSLGATEDAKEFRSVAQEFYEQFNDRFWNEEKGIYETKDWMFGDSDPRSKYRQTSNILPLAFGLVPEDRLVRTADNLVKDIRTKGNHLDTGAVGTRYLLEALSDSGHTDTAMDVLLQTTYPSWGYWLSLGATGMWEGWERTTRSHDHFFLGTFDNYLYSHLLGIRDIRDGYRNFTIAPEIGCGLDFAEGYIETPMGKLSCSWKREGAQVRVEILVPEGASALVRLPDKQGTLEITAKGGTHEYLVQL